MNRLFLIGFAAFLGSGVFAQQPASLTALQLQNFESLADQVKLALQSGDLAKANQLASDLMTGIFKIRKASEPGSFDLATLANAAFDAGEFDAAESYAKELLWKFSGPKDVNHGTAVFVGNNVLGRVALRRDGDVLKAKDRLLAAALTPGSPVLMSFGPNMSLARDLLEKNEREIVLEFFSRCRAFWKLGQPKLDAWTAAVKGGGMPEFGANLTY